MGAVTSCDHTEQYASYYIGLTIAKDDSVRVFPDGERFDYQVHGPLYETQEMGIPENCPLAVLDPQEPQKLQIEPSWYCEDILSPYICFKPKKSPESKAVLGGEVGVSSNFFAVAALLQVATVCLVCFLFLQIKRLKSKKSEQTTDSV